MIKSRYCCTPKCGAVKQANIYTEEGAKGHCGPCFKTAISKMTESQRSFHETQKVLCVKAQWEQAGSARYVAGAPLDAHLVGFAEDPELLSIQYIPDGDYEGLMTMLPGFLPKVTELVRVKGYKLKSGKDLINKLMYEYDVLPDKSICVKGHGPDDEGHIKLKDGLDDLSISLWFREYQRDEHGNIKFGMSEEFLDKTYKTREKLQARKAAAARGESEGAGDKGSHWTSTDVHSMCSGLKEHFPNAKMKTMSEDEVKSVIRNRSGRSMRKQCKKLFETTDMKKLLKNKDFQAAAASEEGARAVLEAKKKKRSKK